MFYKTRRHWFPLFLLAMLMCLSNLVAQTEMTIAEMQQPGPSDPDQSSHVGELVTVEGVLVTPPDHFYSGSHSEFYLVDENGGDFGGVLVALAYPDTIHLEERMFIRITGIVSEQTTFNPGHESNMTCLVPNNPEEDHEILDRYHSLPEPLPGDMWNLDPIHHDEHLAENLEGSVVELENVTVVDNSAPPSWRQFTVADSAGNEVLVRTVAADFDDYPCPPLETFFAQIRGVVYHAHGTYSVLALDLNGMASPGPPPAPVTDLAIQHFSNHVQLTWSPVDEDIEGEPLVVMNGYEVFRVDPFQQAPPELIATVSEPGFQLFLQPPYQLCDYFHVRVLGFGPNLEFPLLTSEWLPEVEGAQQWLTGVDWGGAMFGGGADIGINFFGSTLGLEDMKSVEWSLTPNEEEWSDAAVYRRDLGYEHVGIGTFPGSAWDVTVDPPRRLNICFVEYDEPDDPHHIADGFWNPNAVLGGRQYLFIMNSDYNGAVDYDGNEHFGLEDDVLWAVWPNLIDDSQDFDVWLSEAPGRFRFSFRLE
jgi:hypothetical protein